MTNKDWRSRCERLLNDLADTSVRPYSTRDFGREKYPDAISVIVPDDAAHGLVSTLRPLLPEGTLAFIGTSKWLSVDAPSGVEVVIGEGDSQFDMLVIAASNAINYDMNTGDLIRQLEHYDRWVGINILQAGSDRIQFDMMTFPDDLDEFAQDLYAFCPDIVDQGFGTLDRLKDVLEISRMVTLWWD